MVSVCPVYLNGLHVYVLPSVRTLNMYAYVAHVHEPHLNVCVCVCVCKMCVTSRSDRGVLSPSGRCCSRARTMQFAMMVVRIIHSNGVQLELKPIAPGRSMHLIYSTQHCNHSHHKDPATDTCKHFYNGFEKKSSLTGDIFLSVALNVCLHIHYSL